MRLLLAQRERERVKSRDTTTASELEGASIEIIGPKFERTKGHKLWRPSFKWLLHMLLFCFLWFPRTNGLLTVPCDQHSRNQKSIRISILVQETFDWKRTRRSAALSRSSDSELKQLYREDIQWICEYNRERSERRWLRVNNVKVRSVRSNELLESEPEVADERRTRS